MPPPPGRKGSVACSPMSHSLSDKLVVAISSRALFDLDEANVVYEREGIDAYRRYQLDREETPLAPGAGFSLAKALLGINERGQGDLVEVVLVSRNDADTGLRVMNSAEAHGLSIRRACFTGGRASFGYLGALSCDLFLSAHEEDVRQALEAGFAAGLVYRPPTEWNGHAADNEVRIAFDGDAVLFDPVAEQVYRDQGLAAFHEEERRRADEPLLAGPFKGFLSALHRIQRQFPADACPIRTALVTARSAPAHKRPVKTLRAWDIRIDEAYFLGGIGKEGILARFRPHIFFDDQPGYCEPASLATPTARVLERPAPLAIEPAPAIIDPAPNLLPPVEAPPDASLAEPEPPAGKESQGRGGHRGGRKSSSVEPITAIRRRLPPKRRKRR